jgi:exosortase/archaeosortase family protein
MGEVKDFNRKAIVFLIKFFLIYAVLQTLILVAPIEELTEFIALTEANALGFEAEGNIIMFNEHRFEIVANCTGLLSISVLAAIVFSLRKPSLKKKLSLFAVGALILFPLNLFRVYTVLLVSVSFNPGIAESLHIATWFGTSAAIMILWYYLTKRIARVEEFSLLL